MASNANLWVLDFLLEADGLDDTLIKHFHDVNASQFEELPPNTQARLMLRVLRDAPAQPTGIAEAALGALNMLKNLADQLPQNFVSGGNLDALKPPSSIFVDVRTELVLKSLRDQGDHPKLILDTFFPEEAVDPLELARRSEILEGLKGQEEAQQLIAKYPVEKLNLTLLTFVAAARAALGPNMLKLVEKDILEGRYNPHQGLQSPQPTRPSATGQDAKPKAGRGSGKRRRTKGTTTTEEDAAGMLANMSQTNATLGATGGPDPMDGALQAAQAATKLAGEAEQMETSEGGTQRPILQSTPGATADPLTGTPVSSPTDPTRSGKGQPPRRRNGRWNEDETSFLIRMVRELGKGKWKRILEAGHEVFQNRSQAGSPLGLRGRIQGEEAGVLTPGRLVQVDLKDKWRNLERQGVVGPQDLPPPPMPPMAGQIGMPQNAPQIGPDGQIIPTTLMNHNGEPLTEQQAQQYAQAFAHYAQMAASNQAQQQLAPELLQPQMHQMAVMPGQHLQPLPTQQLHQQAAVLPSENQTHEQHTQLQVLPTEQSAEPLATTGTNPGETHATDEEDQNQTTDPSKVEREA